MGGCSSTNTKKMRRRRDKQAPVPQGAESLEHQMGDDSGRLEERLVVGAPEPTASAIPADEELSKIAVIKTSRPPKRKFSNRDAEEDEEADGEEQKGEVDEEQDTEENPADRLDRPGDGRKKKRRRYRRSIEQIEEERFKRAIDKLASAEAIVTESTPESFQISEDSVILDMDRSVKQVQGHSMADFTPAGGWNASTFREATEYFSSFERAHLYLPDPDEAYRWPNRYIKSPEWWDYVGLLRNWAMSQPVDLRIPPGQSNPTVADVLSRWNRHRWRDRYARYVKSGEGTKEEMAEFLKKDGHVDVHTRGLINGPGAYGNPAHTFCTAVRGKLEAAEKKRKDAEAGKKPVSESEDDDSEPGTAGGEEEEVR